MDKVYAKKQFLDHKQLFKDLKLGKNVTNILNSCSDTELDLILKVLHLIGDSQIHVLRKHEQALKRKEKKLAELGSRTYFRALMKTNRQNKLKVVKQFLSVLPFLAESLFF